MGYVARCQVLCGLHLEGKVMGYRFEIDGEPGAYWSRIVASNGETTHVSEQYTTKSAAIRTAERLLADIAAQQQSDGQVEIRDLTGEDPSL